MATSLTSSDAHFAFVNEDGHTHLHLACATNNIEDVVKLLNGIQTDSKPSLINARDKKLRTALLLACERGYYVVVVLLLQHGADMNLVEEYDLTCLHEASFNNRFNVVTALLDHYKGDLQHQLEFANRQDDHGRSALHLACTMGHSDIVLRLLLSQADILMDDKDGQTCLHVACKHNRIEVLVTLLIYIEGMKKELPNEQKTKKEFLNRKDVNGCTALYIASEEGHCETVRQVLQHGADVTSVDQEGNTCLHAASIFNKIEVVKILVGNMEGESKRAFLNTRNKDGNSALFCACERGNDWVVKVLIEHGADNP